MGVGAAFATGLIQRFTQNIGQEMERRAGEKDKLDNYRTLLTTAAVTGGEDFSKENAKVIGEMVARAEGRLAKQGGIDIFGTQGESIFGDAESEFDEMLSKLQGGDPLKKDMTRESIGGYEFLVSDQYTENLGKG